MSTDTPQPTPGPLRVSTSDAWLIDSDGRIVIPAPDGVHPTSPTTAANLHRLAACLNFCIGFDTERIEGWTRRKKLDTKATS